MEPLLIFFLSIINRYIEIFRSSLSEVRASIGPKMRGGPMSGFNQRPAPYDQRDRFGGMNRFSNNGRNARNRGGESQFMIITWSIPPFSIFFLLKFLIIPIFENFVNFPLFLSCYSFFKNYNTFVFTTFNL